MSSLEYHHRELVSFLREVIGTTPELSFIAPDTAERKLLKLILNEGDKHVQQADAAEAIGVKASHLRKKVQLNLNKVLKDFSLNRCGIQPPIQLFFNAVGAYPGGHFACCNATENASKSDGFILPEELQGKLEKARRKLGLISKKTKYLHDMWDVLQFDTEKLSEKEKTAAWFRSGGPNAADFRGGTVVEQSELLGKLNELVFNNKISILEGDGGTGKSVLVRNFAYKLIDSKYPQFIYHYSFKIDHPINDLNEFLGILKGIDGIVILEDIHLASASDIHSIVNNVELKDGSHLLLTARPSYKEHQSKYYPEKLLNLPSICTKDKAVSWQDGDYSKCIDKVIDRYAERNISSFEWTDIIKASVKKVAGGDLWLLSYTLLGCTGKGEAITWLKNRVIDDLREIEKHSKCNPKIILALCPLYINEVLTAQSFLTQSLSFDRKEINELVRIGEVIEHDIDGEVFYGLQHSSCARAYWEYGREYRNALKLRDYKDFIYNYAISEVSNGLQASVEADKETHRELFNRFVSEGKLLKVFEKERYSNSSDATKYIDAIMALTNTGHIQSFSLQLADLFLERKCYAALCLLIGPTPSEKLDAAEYWKKMKQADKYSLMNAFFEDIYPSPIICIIEQINPNSKIKCEMASLIDINKLATQANQCNNLSIIFRVIEYVGRLDKQLARKLCDHMDISVIESKINIVKDVFFRLAFVIWLCEIKSKAGKKFEYMIEASICEYVTALMNHNYLFDPCVQNLYLDDSIYSINPMAAQKLYDYICKYVGLEHYIRKINISYEAEYLGQNKYLLNPQDTFSRRVYSYFSKVDPKNKQKWMQYFCTAE